MKQDIKPKKNSICLCLSAVSILLFIFTCQAQTAPSALLKKTTYKTETIDFGAGGSVSITGAPAGSITVEGWQKNQIEITAEVEVQAATEADLALLSQINTFVIDENFGHVRINSLGTYDKNYMKQATKKFPKNLYNMPFRIDYRIKVPVYCDLTIDGGRGDLNLKNVEGAIDIKVLESNARLNLIGGAVFVTIGSGSADITIASRSWRGRSAEVSLAKGDMKVSFPANLNANVNATVLQNGRIENTYNLLKPREAKTKFTDKSMAAKSGNGGAALSFTVGDGTLKLSAVEN